MAELSKELYSKLLHADSQEEITELLKTGGREDVSAEAVWKKIQERRAKDGVELSLDELEDVAGSALWERDWAQDGCAATVEPGSDCWGTDGGCYISNINYTNLPYATCPKCHRLSISFPPQNALGTWYVRCKYCGEYPMTIEELQAAGLW